MPTNRPNILMLLTDDQSYGDMGCHGNPRLKTPELDRLATISIKRGQVRPETFSTDAKEVVRDAYSLLGDSTKTGSSAGWN